MLMVSATLNSTDVLALNDVVPVTSNKSLFIYTRDLITARNFYVHQAN